jgi:glycosyltransferase involved in cell wall biosynthesis
MNVLMILDKEFPQDNRVEKEIQSMIQHGINVDIACFTRKKLAAREEFNGYTIHRREISTLMYKLSAAILVLPFYFNFWKKFIQELFNQKQYDAIHVHDLPLAKIGYYFKKKYNAKLVCDQHEYYSNWIVHTGYYNKGVGKLINWLSNWTKYEQKYLNKSDLVITIEEPLRSSYIKSVGVPAEKVILVPNTPTLDVFNESNVNKSVVEKYKNDFMLFYAGGIDQLRGLELVLEALGELKHKVPSIKFVVAGKQAKGYDILQIAEKFKVKELVEFIGWIDHSEIPSYIAASQVGIFTPPGNRDEIHNTIATKIYQYMAMSTPIIVSDVKLMKEFVEHHGIGKSVQNSDEFVSTIEKWQREPSHMEEMKKNSISVRNNYVWDSTIKDLINFYN